MSPEPRSGRDGDLELVGAVWRGLGLGQELLVAGDARLALRLAGAGRHANPLELTIEGQLAASVGLLFLLQPGLFLFEPSGVVALVRDTRAAFELEDPLRDIVEEVAIVGDGDDASRVVL